MNHEGKQRWSLVYRRRVCTDQSDYGVIRQPSPEVSVVEEAQDDELITSRTRGSLSTTFVRGVAIADASLLVGLGDEER